LKNILVKKISGLYWNSILIQSSIIFMFLKIFILVPAFCQSNIRLIGHVYDASDGRPLNGAIIKVTGSYFYAISDDEGQFFMTLSFYYWDTNLGSWSVLLFLKTNRLV